MKKLLLLFLSLLLFGWAHGVSKSTINAMADASISDYIYFGAEHMVTGYDHILFLIGIVFFLTQFSDIFKFITAFTIAHLSPLFLLLFMALLQMPI